VRVYLYVCVCVCACACVRMVVVLIRLGGSTMRPGEGNCLIYIYTYI